MGICNSNNKEHNSTPQIIKNQTLVTERNNPKPTIPENNSKSKYLRFTNNTPNQVDLNQKFLGDIEKKSNKNSHACSSSYFIYDDSNPGFG